ncbi:hypothetical protein [Rhodococcoides corynebacterioides]|uniref:hypothetical protein n=1 Tax=Rhodococcoides corynebacterioides TaxID=53972 RepID=UPI001C9AA82E|nr:hypothetical protein [Rhodococcus corynebacterioides]MBY6364931.1 hypothetical protein [Rhodococcus corynebacterioides]
MTPFVLQCGQTLVPIALSSLALITASVVPTRSDCDAALSEIDGIADARIVVLGTDAALAAVLTRLMRKDRLDVELAYVPETASEASHLYRIGTGSRAAKVALSGTATPVPLIRDDLGTAVVGRAVLTGPSGVLTGEAYVDDTRLFSGSVPGVEVAPTLEMPGLRARVQGRRGLFRAKWVAGRAMQLGTPAARLTKDGVSSTRDAVRSTIYRHHEQWLLVR